MKDAQDEPVVLLIVTSGSHGPVIGNRKSSISNHRAVRVSNVTGRCVRENFVSDRQPTNSDVGLLVVVVVVHVYDISFCFVFLATAGHDRKATREKGTRTG
jgi:hypothetical protein